MSQAIRTAPRPRPPLDLLPPRPRRRWWHRLPVVAGVRSFQDRLRSRLAAACALESPPPERFGFRFDTAVRLFMVTGFFHRRYFRVECHGIESLPPGPVMLVANHGSHVLSWDGAMILTSCLLDADPPRLAHGMAEHRLMELPVLGAAARRIGAVDGRRDTCTDLLRAGGVVLTFPEGVKALLRPFRKRYQLAPFGHGFMHVALATGTPIVPVAVIGAEEEAPLLASPRWLARLVRTPVAPLTPTVVVPLPAKYRIHFGAPLRFRGPASAELVARHVAVVRNALQDLVREGLAMRGHVFF
ncbi:MAG TPA: lysophospholipid acyltransferase family protein [Candidatus Binatia bacterium]|nr:lysophospholipid acyltransferase family protein [Candidatus Binatia bacterium]